MKQILVITYDNCDDAETYYPLTRMKEEGYAVTVASLEKKTIRGKHWFTVDADLLPAEIDPAAYDALLLPGGTAPEKLRQNADILAATRAFFRCRQTRGGNLPRSADSHLGKGSLRQALHLLSRHPGRCHQRGRAL